MDGSRNGYTPRCFVFFCEFIKGLIEFYPELFDGEGVGTKHEANFGKKWKSYPTIIQLAGGDIQKIDQVTEEPLSKCLLYLAFQADKAKLDELIHNEAMAKMRH